MAAVDVGPVFGSLAVGFMINLVLYGASFLQCFIYFSRYRRDPIRLKSFVGLLLLVDTVQSGFIASALYEYLVAHFGDLLYLSMANIPVQAHAPLAGFTACVVQIFFAVRIKQLTGYKWAYWLVIALALVSCAGSIAAGISAAKYLFFTEFSKFKWAISVWLVGAAVADVTAAAILVWYLQRQRTGFAVTDGIIDRVVRITLQTGAATSFLAILDLILFLVLPTNDLHLLFNITLPKLYTNSVMSVLNSRKHTMSDSESHPRSSERAISKGLGHNGKPSQSVANMVVFSKQTTVVETFDDSAFTMNGQASSGVRNQDSIPMSPMPSQSRHSDDRDSDVLPTKHDDILVH